MPPRGVGADSLGSVTNSEGARARLPRMPVRRTLARCWWSATSYRFVREDPPVTGSRILLGAPHTSNWDFVHMLAIAWDARLRVRWLGKQELFRGVGGPLMRLLGGVPVDRSNPAGLIEAVIERARTERDFSLVVTPEGTRSGDGWRSGFYRIAMATGLPVTLGFIDVRTRTTGLGPTIRLSGDMAADMDRIRAFYADKAGMKPELRTEPRLSGEGRPASLPPHEDEPTPPSHQR